MTRAPHLGSSHVQVENLDTCLRFPMPPNLAFLFQRLADSAAALVGGAVAVCVADKYVLLSNGTAHTGIDEVVTVTAQRPTCA